MAIAYDSYNFTQKQHLVIAPALCEASAFWCLTHLYKYGQLNKVYSFDL